MSTFICLTYSWASHLSWMDTMPSDFTYLVCIRRQ